MHLFRRQAREAWHVKDAFTPDKDACCEWVISKGGAIPAGAQT